MKPRFTIAAATATMVSVSANAGQTQFGLILKDPELGFRSLTRHTHASATEITIRHAIADDVVGVYCEWEAHVSVGGNSGRLTIRPQVTSNPDGAQCRSSLPGDIDLWAGVPETDIRIVYPDHKTVVKPTPYAKPHNAVLETKDALAMRAAHKPIKGNGTSQAIRYASLSVIPALSCASMTIWGALIFRTMHTQRPSDTTRCIRDGMP